MKKQQKEDKEEEDKYSFIFEKETSEHEMPNIISKFIKVKSGIDIPVDKVEEVLFEDIE
jgi:hypothetical protein